VTTGDIILTVVGNLTDDPDLRYTPSGVPVTHLRVASAPRIYDRTSGSWTDGDPVFMSATIWRQPAENAAQSLRRGTRVVLTGVLRQRSYETAAGEKRSSVELDVHEVAASLRFATVTVQRTSRPEAAASRGDREDPWAAAEESPFDASHAA
jgi:single-strand DNA-binding protein